MDTMDVDSQGCGWEPVAVMTVAWRMEAAAMTTSSFARSVRLKAPKIRAKSDDVQLTDVPKPIATIIRVNVFPVAKTLAIAVPTTRRTAGPTSPVLLRGHQKKMRSQK